MVRKELLEILVCPETKQPLRLLEEEAVKRINEKIQASELANRSGQTLARPLEAVLIREDGQWAYPVCDGIPIMLVEESISTADFS